MHDLSILVAHGVVTGQKPTVTSVTSAQSQFQLASRTVRPSTGKISEFPLPVVWMNERAPSFCLLPLINTKAGVIERNAIGIQTFAVGSVYPNKLRREVQHLPKFLLTFPKRLDQLLLLSDIHPRADEFLQGRVATRDAHATYMTDAAVRPDDSLREVECAMG